MSVSVISQLFLPAMRSASPLLKRSSVCLQQVAGIVNKELRALDKTRPAPYPYQEKDFTSFHAIIDKTSWRLDENSKVIVVDGPVESGKDEFAKTLADRLDMKYIPHAHLDTYYINPYGFDTRTLDHLIRNKKLRSFDIEHFLENPFDSRATFLQLKLMKIRVGQYIDGLAHVLSTGQGVVLNRSIWSDFVFVETMTEHGMLSNNLRDHYYDTMGMTYPVLQRPHLIIYLDTPVDEVTRRIKKRNIKTEMSSPFYKPDVLSTFESMYKDHFLKDHRGHSEILTYDSTQKLDMDEVVEDCERLNLDDYWIHDEKMADWRKFYEEDWNRTRWMYTHARATIEDRLDIYPRSNILELQVSGSDMRQYYELLDQCPGYEYETGYNEHLGDTDVLFKIRSIKTMFGKRGPAVFNP